MPIQAWRIFLRPLRLICTFAYRQRLVLPIGLILFADAALANAECVVLLHGLARTSGSMSELERKLGRAGYDVANIDYPSRRHTIDALARDAVPRGIEQCRAGQPEKIHFVTHSLGGILVRYYMRDRSLAESGRVVMLGPPNQGAKIVDHLAAAPWFRLLGPAGAALGTGPGAFTTNLGPVDFDLGVIAGDLGINPLGPFLLKEPNDSIVTVASTRVDGMNEHLVLPVTHTFMKRNNRLIDHVLRYLKTGSFARPQPEPKPRPRHSLERPEPFCDKASRLPEGGQRGTCLGMNIPIP